MLVFLSMWENSESNRIDKESFRQQTDSLGQICLRKKKLPNRLQFLGIFFQIENLPAESLNFFSRKLGMEPPEG